MRFGSVCSGIEAASVAWHPLGWRAAWLAEIEPFPSAVLAHHYPEVPNHGNMTALPQLIRSGKVEAPDLFCGGTPCQAFSVAGLRRSLDDERGNLSLTFVEIADAIDDVRHVRGEPPSIVVWENVPGVLSTKDNAFGCFLGALAGCDTAIEPLAATGWTDAGVVAGPQRTVSWRVLDAQYFGLAQRRKRVFVVASARDGFDPAAVLLEFEGVRRDSAPSREAGKGVARGAATGAGSGVDFQNVTDTGDLCGTLMGEAQKKAGQAGHGVLAFGGGQNCTQTDVSTALSAHPGGSRLDFQTETFVTHTLGTQCSWATEDETGRGTPLVPVAFDTYNQTMSETAQTLCSRGDTPGGNAHLVPAVLAHAFDARQSNVIQYGDKTGPLDTDGHSVGVLAFDTTQVTSASNYSNPRPGDPCHPLAAGAHAPAVAVRTANTSANGHGISAELAHTLDQAQGQAVAFTTKLHNTTNNQAGKIYEEYTTSLDRSSPPPALLTPMQVRRLTPVECSRLQGFPDDYLELTYADADEAHSAQVLHELWQEAGAPTVEKQGWRAGISAALLAPEILLAGVYGGWLSWELAERCAAARGALPGEDYCHEGFVLALREAGKARRSPYKRESFGQLARKLGSGLSILPLESAQARKVLRSSQLWPEAQAKWPLRYALAKGKAREAIGRMNPDGPRYKALGNSWAVPVVRWIGQRIQEAL